MSTCTGCGISISCPDGCGVFCTSDCTDCTQWCEPTTVEAFSQPAAHVEGVLIRIKRKPGTSDIEVAVGSEADKPGSGKHPPGTQFRLCFNDLPLASLARLLGSLHDGKVRVAQARSGDRASGMEVGTLAEIAARYDLIVQ